jgi:hypothetical protein
MTAKNQPALPFERTSATDRAAGKKELALGLAALGAAVLLMIMGIKLGSLVVVPLSLFVMSIVLMAHGAFTVAKTPNAPPASPSTNTEDD